jgi:uncharacterized membrane protein YidH (DUF202 family)
MPSPDPPRGAARERTGLAWERSALAVGAQGGVFLAVAAHHHAPGMLVLGAALVAVAGAVWRHGRTAYERASVAPQSRALAGLTAVAAMSALAAAVAVLVRL